VKTYKNQYLSSLETVISFIILLQVFSEFVLTSQKYLTTFGYVSDLKVQKNSIGLIVGDFNGDGFQDIASFGGDQIRFFYQNPDSLSFSTNILFTKQPIVAAVSAKLNRDNITDIVIILDNPPTIASYVGKSNGVFYLFEEKQISNISENILISDIDGDKKNDLIIFGKRALGIEVYLGNGNGTFRDKIVLFPEYSFNEIITADLHNLRAASIIASNWISNEILIFSNYGKLKYSDPTTIQYSSEPTFVKCAYLDEDENIDLLVYFKDENRLITYFGDEYGSFQQAQILNLNYLVDDVEIGDVNNDGANDLGILTKKTHALHILLNNGKGNFSEDVPFFAGINPITLKFFESCKNNLINAAVIDTTNDRIRIFYNSNCSNYWLKEFTYGVGVNPTNIIAVDINDDKWSDVIVANSGSNNLSLFVNDGNGNLGGQIVFQINQSPASLYYYPKDESTKVIITPNITSDNISVIEINPKTYSHKYYGLPSYGKVDVLSISSINKNNHLSLFTLEQEKEKNKSTLIYYEHIVGNRFIQKYYNLKLKLPLLSAAFTKDTSTRRLFYSQHDKINKKQELFVSEYLPTDEFTDGKIIFSIDAPEELSTFLTSIDLNNDKRDDIIWYVGEPENNLYIYITQNDSQVNFKKSIVVNDMYLETKNKLKFFDVNRNGNIDMIYQDRLNKNLYLRFGNNNGTFSLPIKIASISDIGDFCIADLDNDNYPELVITNQKNGTIQILQLQY